MNECLDGETNHSHNHNHNPSSTEKDSNHGRIGNGNRHQNRRSAAAAYSHANSHSRCRGLAEAGVGAGAASTEQERRLFMATLLATTSSSILQPTQPSNAFEKAYPVNLDFDSDDSTIVLQFIRQQRIATQKSQAKETKRELLSQPLLLRNKENVISTVVWSGALWLLLSKVGIIHSTIPLPTSYTTNNPIVARGYPTEAKDSSHRCHLCSVSSLVSFSFCWGMSLTDPSSSYLREILMSYYNWRAWRSLVVHDHWNWDELHQGRR